MTRLHHRERRTGAAPRAHGALDAEYGRLEQRVRDGGAAQLRREGAAEQGDERTIQFGNGLML